MKFKSTKEERLDRIYRSYAVDVYHACLYLTKNDESLAQDMLQQTFLNFYEADKDIKPECIKAYLIRTARNLIFNYYRHAKFECSECEYEDVSPIQNEAATESVEEDYLRKEELLEKKEVCAEMMEHMKEYDKNWYDVFYMKYYLEKSHEEIAEELGITKDVLYSRLYRAKLWIRKNYGARLKGVVEKV